MPLSRSPAGQVCDGFGTDGEAELFPSSKLAGLFSMMSIKFAPGCSPPPQPTEGALFNEFRHGRQRQNGCRQANAAFREDIK